MGFVPIPPAPLSFCFVHNAGRGAPDRHRSTHRLRPAGRGPGGRFPIAERIDAGETVEAIAADYDLGPSEIEEAALYERAA